MDLGALLGAIITTTNTLGVYDGDRHAERYVAAQNRAACAEYVINNGNRDPLGAAWQCGAFGSNGVAVASDFKSNIIRWQNALNR